MILIGWPRLLKNGVALARKSIALTKEDTIVVFESHLMCLAWLLMRTVTANKHTSAKLVLRGFIYTPRQHRLHSWLKAMYCSRLLRHLDLVVCYSHHERKMIEALVGQNGPMVRAVRYGIGEGRLIAAWYRDFSRGPKGYLAKKVGSIKLLSAGRSSRDYHTLAAAMRSPLLIDPSKRFSLDIICDNVAAAPKSLQSDQITLYRSLFGGDYIRKLLAADIVVIPLANDDISAGQMVLLQALAAGKPLVLSDTMTTREYLTPSRFCRFVPMGDPDALAHALSELSAQLPLSKKNVDAQRALYDAYFTEAAHAREFCETITECLCPPEQRRPKLKQGIS